VGIVAIAIFWPNLWAIGYSLLEKPPTVTIPPPYMGLTYQEFGKRSD
jgi:hypothetical protein